MNKTVKEDDELFRKHGIIVDSIDNKGEDKDKEEERYYTLLRYKCKRCGFEFERRYNSPEAWGGGMVTCTCGAFHRDPHPLWPQFGCINGADPYNEVEEYFETAPIPKENTAKAQEE